MKSRAWLWLSAFVLLLTVLLTSLLRDVVRDWVALPLARILRIGNLMLGAVPQIVFWALLLSYSEWLRFPAATAPQRRQTASAPPAVGRQQFLSSSHRQSL